MMILKRLTRITLVATSAALAAGRCAGNCGPGTSETRTVWAFGRKGIQVGSDKMYAVVRSAWPQNKRTHSLTRTSNQVSTAYLKCG